MCGWVSWALVFGCLCCSVLVSLRSRSIGARFAHSTSCTVTRAGGAPELIVAYRAYNLQQVVLLLSWNISCGWGQCVSCALCVCVFSVSTQVHIPPIYSWQHWEQSVLRERVSIYTLLPRTLLNSSPVRHADTFCSLLKDDECDFCASSGTKRNCKLFVLANITTTAQLVMWVKVWLLIKYKTRGAVKGSHFLNSFWCWINYTIHLWTNSSSTIKII